LVDAGGLPLVVAVSAANVPDVLTLEAMIDHRPAIGGTFCAEIHHRSFPLDTRNPPQESQPDDSETHNQIAA
jgi:hypothetical protein